MIASPTEAVYVIIIIIIQEQQILGDVLITEPCSKTLTRHQAETQGWAARKGEVSKMSKYGGPASQGGRVFLPFVFETYGLWGKSLQDFFASTMKHAEEYRGIPGAADPWRCPHHRALLQDPHQTSGRDPRLGSQERRSLEDV